MKKTLLIATVALVTFTPPAGGAAKDTTTKSCPNDAICVWTKDNYRGKRVVVKSDNVSNKIGNTINNRTSSIKNRFGQTILIYDKRDAMGESRCVGGLGKVARLGDSYNFDNRATSSDVPDDPSPCV